ncbi:MAG: hypothetical protein AAGC96_18665 [Pseudomonadota bacterium]
MTPLIPESGRFFCCHLKQIVAIYLGPDFLPDLLGAATLLDGSGSLHIVRHAFTPNNNQANHSHGTVGLALESVDTWFVQSELEIPVQLAFPGLCPFRNHALDRDRVVAFVGLNEFEGITGFSNRDQRIEDHSSLDLGALRAIPA